MVLVDKEKFYKEFNEKYPLIVKQQLKQDIGTKIRFTPFEKLVIFLMDHILELGFNGTIEVKIEGGKIFSPVIHCHTNLNSIYLELEG